VRAADLPRGAVPLALLLRRLRLQARLARQPRQLARLDPQLLEHVFEPRKALFMVILRGHCTRG